MSTPNPTLPHNSQAPQVLGVCITMLILVTIIVAARFWIRLSLTKSKIGADDWCILVAWALAAAFALDPINQVHFGLGQHYYDLPEHNDFGKSLEVSLLFRRDRILYMRGDYQSICPPILLTACNIDDSGFVVVTGMIRLYYLKGAQDSNDPSYDNVGGAVWSCIESSTGVICASLPQFKPLFDRFFPNLMGRPRGIVTGENPSNRNYIKQSNRSDTEYELENQKGKSGWKDTSYPVTFNNNMTNNIEGGTSLDSDIHASDPNGIYKSTQIVLTRTAAD